MLCQYYFGAQESIVDKNHLTKACPHHQHPWCVCDAVVVRRVYLSIIPLFSCIKGIDA